VACVDLETTGGAAASHRVIEVGIVLLDGGVVVEEWSSLVNPGCHIPRGITTITGIDTGMVAEAPRFEELGEAILRRLTGCLFVAHNAGFDFGFLNMELGACLRDPVCRSRMIDTVALAKTRHPGAKLSLDALCTRYGIDRSHRVKHGALLDAELLAQLYVELSGGRQIGLGLVAEAASAVPTAVLTLRERPYRAPRPHAPSEDELVRHAAFLATLVDPIWAQAR